MKIEDIKSWKKVSCLITLFGGLFFIIVTIIAMFFYPGGYSFVNNYFSDLGTTRTWNELRPNPISSKLFLISCIVTGITLIPFWIVITTLFSEGTYTKFFSYIGSIFGLISCPSLMAVGILASDLYYVEHVIAARLFFLSFAAAIMIYSIAILFNNDYNNIYSFIGMGFSFFIVLYIFRVLDLINPLAQKIIAYGFVVWVIIQITKIWKLDDK